MLSVDGPWQSSKRHSAGRRLRRRSTDAQSTCSTLSTGCESNTSSAAPSTPGTTSACNPASRAPPAKLVQAAATAAANTHPTVAASPAAPAAVTFASIECSTAQSCSTSSLASGEQAHAPGGSSSSRRSSGAMASPAQSPQQQAGLGHLATATTAAALHDASFASLDGRADGRFDAREDAKQAVAELQSAADDIAALERAIAAASWLDGVPGEERQKLRAARSKCRSLRAAREAAARAAAASVERSPWAQEEYDPAEFERLVERYESLNWRMIQKPGGASVRPEPFYELHALHMQALHGDNTAERPMWAEKGGLDFEGRARWDAWSGLRGVAADAARLRFVRTFREFPAGVLYKDNRGGALEQS